MGKQTFIIIGGVSGLLLVAAVATFLMLRDTSQKPTIIPNQTTRNSQSSTDSIPLTATTQGNSIPLGSGQSGVGQSQGLSVLGSNSTQSNDRSSQSRLPNPDEFEIYEEYADSQNALYLDIVEGNGREASAGDTLAVVYQGWLTDGTLFDQSRRNEQGQIEAFTLTLGQNQVIRGWEEGLLGMREGGKRRIVIPSVAGYGSAGQGSIPPDSMLIFDVELAQVEEPPSAGIGL